MSTYQQQNSAGGSPQNQTQEKKTKDELMSGLDDNQAGIVEALPGFVSDDGSLWCDYEKVPSIIELPDGQILKVKDQAKHPDTFIPKITAREQGADKVIYGLHFSTWFTQKGVCYVVIRNDRQFKAKYPNGFSATSGGGRGGYKNSGGSWQVLEEALVIERVNLAGSKLDDGLKVESAKVKELIAAGFQPHGPNGNDSMTTQYIAETNDLIIIRRYAKKKPPAAVPAPATTT